MRRRYTIPLIAAVGIAPWFWFYPSAPSNDWPAKLATVLQIPEAGGWLGGLSGFDISPDGRNYHMVTDRGHWARGALQREGVDLTGITISEHQKLKDRFGETPEFPSTDAEGLALDSAGQIHVSFEQAHRVLRYDSWDSAAYWPSYTTAWRAMSLNQGLEALAVAPDGTLFAIPEEINFGATESLVYRKKPEGDWEQAFTLPIHETFLPVGADFGPDGRFYLLERGLYPFGFFSRVRVMDVSENGFSNFKTLLRTKLGDHGNLEGLGVWQDAGGQIRLTMVSDDNFYAFMRGEIVEYVLEDRVAIKQ
ncbi:MAG: esterase-like activity of phytase family protein [Roseobacter sp.]